MKTSPTSVVQRATDSRRERWQVFLFVLKAILSGFSFVAAGLSALVTVLLVAGNAQRVIGEEFVLGVAVSTLFWTGMGVFLARKAT